MTWLDLLLIVIFLGLVALGARLGSLWTGACILGGFLGAALVDTYSLPLSDMMGGFPGSTALAALLLYVGGVAAMLIPGSVLSKIGSVVILNLFDGVCGIFTGAFAATFLISMFLFLSVVYIPRFESSKAYKKSVLTKPYYRVLEEIFSQTPFKSPKAHKKIKKEAFEKIDPLAKEASKAIKGIESEIGDKLK